MRRYWLLGCLLLLLAQTGRAEGLKMRDVFKQMPDSLLPYLSKNNRLDFIDFMESDGAEDSDVICLIETFGSDSLSLESKVRFYTPAWQLLNNPPQLSPSDQNTISSKKVQTILKRDDEILKKN